MAAPHEPIRLALSTFLEKQTLIKEKKQTEQRMSILEKELLALECRRAVMNDIVKCFK